MVKEEQLNFFNLIDLKNLKETNNNDPCDRCNKPYCYGCKYVEEE